MNPNNVINNIRGTRVRPSTKQMRDAAYNGVWHCHGYSLEPDADCPKCGCSITAYGI